MPILPIIVALAASSTSAYPEGFTAQCTNQKEAYVWLDSRDLLHPTIRRPTPPRPVASSDPIAIPGYVPPQGGTVTISYRRHQFSVELRGPDLDVVQTNGREFDLKELRASPGDLVLSVQTSSWGASITVYHLRYKGHEGALSVAETAYDHGNDRTSLAVMTCKIGKPSSQ